MTNMWLRKAAGKEAAIRIVTAVDGVELDHPQFEVLLGKRVNRAEADEGTISRGKGVSPYDKLVIDGDYIKDAAQSGQMSQVLYAVAIRKADGERTFRSPTQADLDAINAATSRLGEVEYEWRTRGILPTEDVPDGSKTSELIRYGIETWADSFTSRQVLVHGTWGEEFAGLFP